MCTVRAIGHEKKSHRVQIWIWINQKVDWITGVHVTGLKMNECETTYFVGIRRPRDYRTFGIPDFPV